MTLSKKVGAMASSSRFPLWLTTFVLVSVSTSVTYAGDVAGRVVVPAPPIAASFGSPGTKPGGHTAEEPDLVLVYVAEAAAELSRETTPGVRLRIAGGRIVPKLVALSLGSVLVIENADRRAHRLVARGGPDACDLGLLKSGQMCEYTVRETGIIPLWCALHKDAAVEVVVLAHTAFTFADGGGAYSLPGVPPGVATIVAYSPRFGEVSRVVTVPDTGQVEASFRF